MLVSPDEGDDRGGDGNGVCACPRARARRLRRKPSKHQDDLRRSPRRSLKEPEECADPTKPACSARWSGAVSSARKGAQADLAGSVYTS